jgi:hypothetical protein
MSKALSWHGPTADVVPAVPSGVPGVVVVDASGVEVSGMSVGKAKPGFVGGKVDVTKRGAAVFAASCETLTHEPRLRLVSRSNIQIFFIREILLGKYYKVPHNCLTRDLNFGFPIHVKIYLLITRVAKKTPSRHLHLAGCARECR